ncbi:MAG: CinA family protein [Acidobacteriota bacterium]
MDTGHTMILVQDLARALQARGCLMTTAESCTGGLIAAACTELSGSSNWFDRGVVTYSNEAKTDLLGVPAALIAQHGAVSEEVARAMAKGALMRSRAHAAVAVTGVAGPTGGSVDKPVGTVWLAWATRASAGADQEAERVIAKRCLFPGDRSAVRSATVVEALQSLNRLLDQA